MRVIIIISTIISISITITVTISSTIIDVVVGTSNITRIIIQMFGSIVQLLMVVFVLRLLLEL